MWEVFLLEENLVFNFGSTTSDPWFSMVSTLHRLGVSQNAGFPQQPLVFLLKIIILGVFWGYHHFRKHPDQFITPSWIQIPTLLIESLPPKKRIQPWRLSAIRISDLCNLRTPDLSETTLDLSEHRLPARVNSTYIHTWFGKITLSTMTILRVSILKPSSKFKMSPFLAWFC